MLRKMHKERSLEDAKSGMDFNRNRIIFYYLNCHIILETDVVKGWFNSAHKMSGKRENSVLCILNHTYILCAYPHRKRLEGNSLLTLSKIEAHSCNDSLVSFCFQSLSRATDCVTVGK